MPGDDVLALGVHQELAVETGLAGRGVAGERHTGTGVLALVAEDHLLHVDSGADVVRDPVRAPVDLGARGVPRVEDGAHRAGELAAGVLREPTHLLGVDLLVGLDQLGEILGGEVGVAGDIAPSLEVGELLLEPIVLDPVDDLAVHLDQAPVRVGGEARVARALGEPLHGVVVEPEVQDRVHHPRHRDRRARAHRYEQRVVRVAEALAGLLLEPRERRRDLLLEALWELLAGGLVGAARVGRDREAAGYRDAELRHLRQAASLAPEEGAPALAGLVKVVCIGHVANLSTSAEAGKRRGFALACFRSSP